MRAVSRANTAARLLARDVGSNYVALHHPVMAVGSPQPIGADTALLSCVGKSGNVPPGGCSRDAELAAKEGAISRSLFPHHQLAAACKARKFNKKDRGAEENR